MTSRRISLFVLVFGGLLGGGDGKGAQLVQAVEENGLFLGGTLVSVGGGVLD